MKKTTEKIIEGLQKPTWTVGHLPSNLSELLAASNQAMEALLCAKAWDIYDKNSPEMKRINDAIDRLGKAIVLSGG
jgi:hypothetical protein